MQFDDEKFIENYLLLDDSRLFQKIMSNPQSNSCKLMKDLENRNLLKRGFEIELKGIPSLKKRKLLNMKPNDFRELESNLAEKCDCDKDFIIAYLQKIDNALYKSSYEFFKVGKTPILIEDEDGEPHELEEESPIFAKQEPKHKFFIFCPEKDKLKIREFAKDLILN